ncbi:MAG: tRNA pseudouridine(38-40) synthase TruA [Cellulosilyticaceae bacterium]
MYNYKMIIAYDGTRYIGWQRQATDPLKTIQGKLEHILSLLFDEEISVTASGRTDAGVHAIAQVANFQTKVYKSPEEILNYMAKYLSTDISIVELKLASERFHARYNCKYKMYSYTIDTGLFPNPFQTRFAYHLPESLNLDAMKKAADHLLGTHDFKSFTSMKSKKKSTVRTITNIDITQVGTSIVIYYRGDGFLQHMVRILTGTLIEVGTGKRLPEDILHLLEVQKRSESGYTVPPHGLCLQKVEY